MASDDQLPPATQIPPEFDFKLYRYTPSLEGAIVSLIVFALLTIAHYWRLKKARAYYFTVFTIGGLCMSSSTYTYPITTLLVFEESVASFP